ncbi:MAG: phosphodiester glycosidase family protein [Bacteroidales bacterium]|nr:phosphodiester glycosidase family protein [Bacteroidales bacterium]
MKHILNLLLIALFAVPACSSDDSNETALDAPGNVIAQMTSETSITLSWSDCAAEQGYYVFLSKEQKPYAKLPANTSSYLFENLEMGATYRLGVQAVGKGEKLSQAVFAEPVTLPDPVPEDEIRFTWTEVPGLGLPASVKIYKTTDQLEGRPFNAWYAIADCRQDVELKVIYPGKGATKTIDKQAEDAGNCLVLINGGIFGTAPIGFAVMDGVQTPWRYIADDNWAVDKQYWGAVPNSAYERLHPVSRGLFGVDNNGVPGVYWSYTPEHGTIYVYDNPIPTVAGEAVKQEGSKTYPCVPANWAPYNAVTCGPVLLKNGECPINDKKNSSGHWLTNYELWADDIYGVDQRADRTAVGYTSDGKVILFICDGRISASQGANTLELAKVMKGLGCIGALNLDGGGSTGMWAGGQHLNDLTGGNRPVMTSIGFFRK